MNAPEDSETLDRFVPEPEVLALTGLSRTTRWRLEQRGEFPKRHQISPGRKASLLSEIRVWMAKRTKTDAAA